MKLKSLLLSSSLLAGAVAVATPLATASIIPLQVIGIPPVGAGTTSVAYGVSGDGETVVGISQGPNRIDAFRWTNAGGVVLLTGLPPNEVSVPTGVSGNGQVIVGVSSNTRPTRWNAPSYAPIALPHALPAQPNSQANAVSANGSLIVGSTATDVGFRAAVWTASGVTTLPTLSRDAAAAAVNATGSVIVGRSALSNNTSRAVRWVSGTITDLGTLPGGTQASAYAVSADGSVIVGGANALGRNQAAFRWTAETGMVEIAPPADGVSCLAYAVSGDGQTVGGSYSPFTTNAFIWRPDLGFRDFRVFLSTMGVDVAAWQFAELRGISSDGLTFTGLGYHTLPSGLSRAEAFVVRIPTPSSGVCVLACACLTLRRRRNSARVFS